METHPLDLGGAPPLESAGAPGPHTSLLGSSFRNPRRCGGGLSLPCPTPESCWERHPENFPRLISARVQGGLPGSALSLRPGATSCCLPSPSFAASSRAAERREGRSVGWDRLPEEVAPVFRARLGVRRDSVAGVAGARGSLGPGVSHGWEQERAGESARMNDVRSAQGAGWGGGRARGKQSCALPRAPPAGDPALGAAGAARSPARCGARTAAWGRAPTSAGETRAKFAALGPGPPGPPRPASAPGVRAPAASGERRAGRRMGCGLRVLRSARGRGSSGGRGSGRHRLPPGRPAPGILAQFSSAGGQLVAVSPPSLLLIHLRPIFGYLMVVVKWHRLNRRLCSAALGGQG